MERSEIVRANASMTTRVLGMPAAPVPDGGYALRVLRTRGRHSGADRDTPIGVIGHDGAHYLVSPDDTRDWVRNLDADPRCTLLAAGLASPGTAVRPAPEMAATAVRTYLQALDMPWARQAFPVGPDTATDEVAAHMPPISVFRIDPT